MSEILSPVSNLSESLAFFKSDLFHDVQMAGVFPDSKTFADASPNSPWVEIYADYALRVKQPNFSLDAFVEQYFVLPEAICLTNDEHSSSAKSYIESLWPKLEKQPDGRSVCSLLPLSKPYIVPGGRFREIFYWDSYFTALGLVESERADSIQSMLLNFMELQEHLGCIPNGNRSYFSTRSQPPVLGLMVELAAENTAFSSDTELLEYLANSVKSLEKEYEFWMLGQNDLSEGVDRVKRVVRMPNGAVLNRYWDDSAEPRPESYREDVLDAAKLPEAEREAFYRDIRAACESGWDFCSRWMADANEISSIRTTSIVPVDLNCLLYKLESLLADFYRKLGQPTFSDIYLKRAAQRSAAINQYCWDQKQAFYVDYDIQKKQQNNTLSLAGALPLFVQIAPSENAQQVRHKLAEHFLRSGGLVTTLVDSPQQWDSPNGWAPLHWFAVMGLKHYGFDALAKDIMQRWLRTVEQQFAMHDNIMEKYNVVENKQVATGGEYEVQHGFGWTNGVTLAFYKLLEDSDND